MKTFRAIPIARSRDKGNEIPRLITVPLPNHPLSPIQGAFQSLVSPSATAGTQHASEPSVRAFLCHISPDNRGSYLITGGTDSLLRFWDWSTATRCCVLSGLSPTQHRPSVVSVRTHTATTSASTDDIDRQDVSGEQLIKERKGYSNANRKDQNRGQGTSVSQGPQNLFVCYDTDAPSSTMSSPSFQQAQVPLRDSKGTTHSVTASEVRE